MANHTFARLAFDNLTTAVLLLNDRLSILEANNSAENLLSASASQLLDSDFRQYLLDNDAAKELIQALNTESGYTYRETQLHLAPEQTITVDYTVTPLESRQLLLEIQPVDRILRINREEALLATQATSQEMVRGLAHEVKNPLGGIKGAAQLLATELNDEQREYTDLIITETKRLSGLVDRLLGPTQPLKLDIINIHQITEHVASLLEAETQGQQNRKLNLIRDYDPSVPELEADHDQLVQVVLNIARNALQAIQDQSNSQITLRSRIQRNFTIGRTAHRILLRLDIEDNGPGIPPEIADRIFYPMISGRQGGSGLGLPIAQTIISRHHGLIECSSNPGKTRFSIFLPLSQPRNRKDD